MDAVWISLEGKVPVDIDLQQLTVAQSMLTEVYNDQTNLINVKWPNGKDSALLNKKKKVAEINLR